MSSRSMFSLAATFFIVVFLVIGAFKFTERVPEGKVAVVYSPSGGAKKVLSPGWHVIGFFDQTQQYPTRITIVKANVNVTTSDGKKVTIPARYEMKVDKSKILDIFKELGSQNIEEIQEGYLYQRLFKASRETVSQYSVLDIFGGKASEASAKVTEHMRDSSEGLGFIVTDVTLETPEVDEDTQKAIDMRVATAQKNENLKLQESVERQEATNALIKSKGIADAKIEEARGEMEANKLLEQSITPELLKMKELEARMKHGWVTINGAPNLIVDETSGKE